MSEDLKVGLAIFGGMAAVGWWVWISMAASCISDMEQRIQRLREKTWDERDKADLAISMLEQRIIKLEEGKKK